MDERFPKWLRIVVGRLDFLGVPNLAPLITALMVLAIIAQVTGAPYQRFIFDPVLVLQGEWWRLFAFPIPQSIDSPIFLILYVVSIYFVVNSVEGHWGSGPTTIFIMLGYLAALAASFVTGQPLSIWFYILENMWLAFGTLFPDFEILLFFILPVKAKWLSMFAGALIFFQFIIGGWETKTLVFITMIPYLLFFSPMLYRAVKAQIKLSRHKRKYHDDMWR